MAMEHVTAVVDRYRRGRTNRAMANAADIPLHWLADPLKPGTSMKKMPDDGRIAELARAIGAPFRELRDAFADDITGRTGTGEMPADMDALTAQMWRVWEDLDVPYRVMLLGFGRSTATLQRKLGTRNNEIREVG